ncbi:heme-dependent oxidative N-demethylase family protein [Aquamicrobium terrae]|uniref:heme-dependent oxidative N-demethylase family protein n=1 Tax=Aquamicrobium terrae TaxID=1324945 RepID=UPI0033976971
MTEALSPLPAEPAYTPYDGSTRPFTIGLKPLDLAKWIEIDRHFEFQMAEKRRVYAEHGALAFVEEEGTEAVQVEVLELLTAHLRAYFPERYQDHDGQLAAIGQPPPEPGLPPLKTASLLIQEDLIVMRRSADGWRLVAGALCFPSSWSLREKFGRTMQDIHIPVPAFGPGTRTAGLIERIFDNLAVEQPVERFNWSIQAGDALYHPLSDRQRIDRSGRRLSRLDGDDLAASTFMRVERQTLRKLPASGDILFTIRIFLDPLGVLERHADRAVLAASFAAQLSALDQSQLDYKGLAADRDRLVALLHHMSR